MTLLTYTATFAAAAGSKCSGNESFTRSWRTMKEYPSRRSNTHLLEHVGVQEWEKGHFLELRDICGNHEQIQETVHLRLTIFKSTNIIKRDISVHSKRIGVRKS